MLNISRTLRWKETFILLSVIRLFIERSCHFVNAEGPLALHQLHEVEVDGEIVISLQGLDLDGDKTSATITSLPTYGSIYQLTQVFNTHGYDPKAGEEIISVPTIVKGSKSRLVYKRPYFNRHMGRNNILDQFEYIVADSTSTSEAGKVTLISPNNVVVGSDFILDDEKWITTGNKNQGVSHETSSRGEMNYFIYATDDSINVNLKGDDLDIWRFQAPSQFLGWHGILYGGTFDFTLSSFSGDFSPSNLNFDGKMNLVEISCAECLRGKGITLGYPLLSSGAFSGSTTKFSINMTETSGWVKDPHNVLLSWTNPTKCDFMRVLSGITSVTILGDFSRWYESVSIDSVFWRSPNAKGRLQLPICAQKTPDVRVCACKP